MLPSRTMFWARRRTLLKMIATYEEALLRIAGKPEEHRRLLESQQRLVSPGQPATHTRLM